MLSEASDQLYLNKTKALIEKDVGAVLRAARDWNGRTRMAKNDPSDLDKSYPNDGSYALEQSYGSYAPETWPSESVDSSSDNEISMNGVGLANYLEAFKSDPLEVVIKTEGEL